jgi:hypothetical protein
MWVWICLPPQHTRSSYIDGKILQLGSKVVTLQPHFASLEHQPEMTDDDLIGELAVPYTGTFLYEAHRPRSPPLVDRLLRWWPVHCHFVICVWCLRLRFVFGGCVMFLFFFPIKAAGPSTSSSARAARIGAAAAAGVASKVIPSQSLSHRSRTTGGIVATATTVSTTAATASSSSSSLQSFIQARRTALKNKSEPASVSSSTAAGDNVADGKDEVEPVATVTAVARAATAPSLTTAALRVQVPASPEQRAHDSILEWQTPPQSPHTAEEADKDPDSPEFLISQCSICLHVSNSSHLFLDSW